MGGQPRISLRLQKSIAIMGMLFCCGGASAVQPESQYYDFQLVHGDLSHTQPAAGQGPKLLGTADESAYASRPSPYKKSTGILGKTVAVSHASPQIMSVASPAQVSLFAARPSPYLKTASAAKAQEKSKAKVTSVAAKTPEAAKAKIITAATKAVEKTKVKVASAAAPVKHPANKIIAAAPHPAPAVIAQHHAPVAKTLASVKVPAQPQLKMPASVSLAAAKAIKLPNRALPVAMAQMAYGTNVAASVSLKAAQRVGEEHRAVALAEQYLTAAARQSKDDSMKMAALATTRGAPVRLASNVAALGALSPAAGQASQPAAAATVQPPAPPVPVSISPVSVTPAPVAPIAPAAVMELPLPKAPIETLATPPKEIPPQVPVATVSVQPLAPPVALVPAPPAKKELMLPGTDAAEYVSPPEATPVAPVATSSAAPFADKELPEDKQVAADKEPRDDNEAAAPYAVTLSTQSKDIVKSLPPQKSKRDAGRHSVDIKHTQASALDNEDVRKHEGIGISISIHKPKANINHMLENAYDALIAGNQQDAVNLYKEVLNEQPENRLALFGLATTYHRAGQLQLARPLYGKLLAVDPQNAEGLNNFLVLLADESPEQALVEMKKLELSHPDFSPLPAQMAVIYHKMGKLEPALRKMKHAIDLSPENLKYRYDMGIMLDQAGEWEGAATYYQQLITASDRGEKIPAKAEEIQERLTFIRSNKPEAHAVQENPAQPVGDKAEATPGGDRQTQTHLVQ
jgi:Flp pilus assembly protein TadD